MVREIEKHLTYRCAVSRGEGDGDRLRQLAYCRHDNIHRASRLRNGVGCLLKTNGDVCRGGGGGGGERGGGGGGKMREGRGKERYKRK